MRFILIIIIDCTATNERVFFFWLFDSSAAGTVMADAVIDPPNPRGHLFTLV